VNKTGPIAQTLQNLSTDFCTERGAIRRLADLRHKIWLQSGRRGPRPGWHAALAALRVAIGAVPPHRNGVNGVDRRPRKRRDGRPDGAGGRR